MKNQIRDIAYVGLCTALIAVTAQLSIPMPLGVPMTLQTFAITLVAIVLGPRLGTLSTLIYILIGALGVPVFANFSSGVAKLIGPTGGFLVSFPIMALLIGLGVKLRGKFFGAFALFLILGTVINYVIGVAMFCALLSKPVSVGITACVVPFIPTAIIKAVLASVIGLKLRDILIKNGLLRL